MTSPFSLHDWNRAIVYMRLIHQVLQELESHLEGYQLLLSSRRFWLHKNAIVWRLNVVTIKFKKKCARSVFVQRSNTTTTVNIIITPRHPLVIAVLASCSPACPVALPITLSHFTYFDVLGISFSHVQCAPTIEGSNSGVAEISIFTRAKTFQGLHYNCSHAYHQYFSICWLAVWIVVLNILKVNEVLSNDKLPEEYRISLAKSLQDDLFTRVSFIQWLIQWYFFS